MRVDGHYIEHWHRNIAANALYCLTAALFQKFAHPEIQEAKLSLG